MSKVRETLITNCERKFLNKCLSDQTRVDGRSFSEFRPLELKFGKHWGSCYVSLGKTKVLAQTSCEIQQPKSTRPSEGILNINIELNPLAAPHFEPGRQSELSIQLNRLLEKCVKDSKAVDLESLCIKTNEKVWVLKVDINVLNHEGNILDCASIAMLASLAHFRCPDVTCDGEEFIIHSYQQRDAIPIVIHHYPVCITYAIFNGGEYILADPLLLEEGSADAMLTVGLNGFRELCALHLGGKAELSPDIILGTVSKAASRAAIVVEEIKNSIKADNEQRDKKLPVGFHIESNFKTSSVFAASLNQWQTKKNKRTKNIKKKELGDSLQEEKVEIIEKGSVEYTPDEEDKNIDLERVDISDDDSLQHPTKVDIIGKGAVEYIPDQKDKKMDWERVDSSDDDLFIVEKPKVEIQVLDTDSEEDVIILGSGTPVKSMK